MPTRYRLIVTSAVLHLLLLAVALHVRRMRVEPARHPGTAFGSRTSLTFSPGRAPAQASVAKVKSAPAKLTEPAKSRPDTHQTAGSTNTSSPSTASPNAPQGGDALGAGNVTVALATFFPTPRPDLHELSKGARGDVIVDVVIDEQGRVIDSKVAQSMGATIDQAVLATVQTWTFQPATKGGVAVPSEQELLFHYERG